MVEYVSQASAVGIPEPGHSLDTSSASAPAYLFGPLADFLLVGGGSLFVILAVLFLIPNAVPGAGALSVGFVLVTLINQPHFAHSYQLFYRGFGEKIRSAAYTAELRHRYIFAGIVVPAALLGFAALGLIYGMQNGTARIISYAGNLYTITVGWHYAKQGYGLLIVDSVKKGSRFDAREKLLFRVNGYACWIVAWLSLNHTFSAMRELDGVSFYTFPAPALVYEMAEAFCVTTSLLSLFALARHWYLQRSMPWNGMVAYVSSLYPWLIFARVHPYLLLVVPTFHSLQYLAVVWRFELNRSGARVSEVKPGKPAWRERMMKSRFRLMVFVVSGVVLGYFGFVALPQILDRFVTYDHGVFGPSLFVFVFACLINVHHYFLDNVMWRQGNPEIRNFLFQPKPQPSP